MTRLFKWMHAVVIAGYAVMIISCVLEILDVIPLWLDISVFLAMIGLVLLMNFISVKKYAKICDMFNTDLEGFVAKQDELSKNAGKLKMTIDGNTIIALLTHERTEEAERRIDEYAKNIMPSDIMSRFMYSSYRSDLDILKRDFSRIDFYINDQKMCLSQMAAGKTLGINARTVERLQSALEQTMLEAQIYSRTPEMLAAGDRQIAINYYNNCQKLYGGEKDIKVMHDYFVVNLKYEMGMVCAITGDTEKAREYLTAAAQSGYTYPFVERAKQWLVSGDVNILMQRGQQRR